jgi:CHAT domain-containing protein
VPFAALVDEDGRYLIEQALVSYVTSGRDLVRSVAEDVAQSKPLVIAAPAYEGRCAPLPGAEAEAEAIRTHFADLELHVGPMATKEKLTAARGPWFVHVATHGFFRRSDASPPGGTRSWRDARDVVGIASSFSLPSRPNIEDALDDAGLMFAGASETEAMLTAREIAAIDLRGTQLIVLSACVTGVGELDRSEGVYGLRRALAIAGAQTQVVSLWKIDDGVTSTLMDRYYGELRAGAGRSEALRRAQRDMLRGGPHGHPFYWAAFVPIGDEGPLRGV